MRQKEFSSTLEDFSANVTGASAQVTVAIDGTTVYDETLTAVDGQVTLYGLSELVTPYARQRQTVTLAITVNDGGTDSTETCEVVYCQADLGETTAADFLDTHFLTLLLGPKTTAVGRLELLHMQGSDTLTVTATYTDGSTAAFTPEPVQSNSHYSSYDLSPHHFTATGKTLAGYAATAGERTQQYVIDQRQPDCAPILCFVNSFGLDEMAYCTGQHKVSPAYNRHTAVFGRQQRNYRIDETRTFSADSGPLTTEEADWWDELFRSQSVRVANVINGEVQLGKDMIITDSKSERTNDDAHLPRFTFQYQYAQLNHNVLQLLRAGRIFDNTFDNTFN